jgi:hypothetical protein
MLGGTLEEGTDSDDFVELAMSPANMGLTIHDCEAHTLGHRDAASSAPRFSNPPGMLRLPREW